MHFCLGVVERWLYRVGWERGWWLILGLGWGATGLLAAEGLEDRLTVYTMWDERYFYLAARVEDINVVGRHEGLMEEVWEDDDLEVFIETNHARADRPTAKCFRLAVSARGGVSFYQGRLSRWERKPFSYVFKCGVEVQGSLNDPTDADQGYVVEIGLPWVMLEGRPRPGHRIGFNLVKFLRGETNGFFSLSPTVRTEQDLNVPARWASLVFKKEPQIGRQDRGVILCLWTGQRPVVDGRISPGEWPLTSALNLVLAPNLIRPAAAVPAPPPPPARPAVPSLLGPERPERPVPSPAPAPSAQPSSPAKTPERPPRGPYRGENFLLAPYYFWYQGDKRHPEAPFAHVRYPDGASQLTVPPLEGAGPWFSTLRVGWHYQQVQAAREAGIDILLPVVWGDLDSQRAWGREGLVSLVLALRERRLWGLDYPLLGLLLDLNSLSREYGEPPNLTERPVQETLYRMIRNFFRTVPPEFRATIWDGEREAYLIALTDPPDNLRLDDTFVAYCEARFRQDFGRELLWLGSPLWYRRGVDNFDGYVPLEARFCPRYEERGRISLGGLAPGYDSTAWRNHSPEIRSRLATRTLREDCRNLLRHTPRWLVFNDWNNYHTGSNLAPSRFYGLRYTDVASLCALQFNGGRDREAKYLQHYTPRLMAPGGTYDVELRLANAGLTHWTHRQDIRLGYRWYRNGRCVEEAGVRSSRLLMRRGEARTVFGRVKAAKADGTPLPPGEYELRWDVVAGDIQWFSLRGDQTLNVPVRLGDPPEYAATIISSTLLLRAESGQTYPVRVRLRNDGTRTWQGVRLGYRWERLTTSLRGEEPPPTLLDPQGILSEVPPSVPGQIVDVAAQVRLTDAQGQPLPPNEEPTMQYRLTWFLLTPDGQPFNPQQAKPYCEYVRVISRDYGVAFVGGHVPQVMPAGQTVWVTLTLSNTAFQTWPAREVAVGYHWYYWDGTEALWDNPVTPLPLNVGSRQKVEVHLPLQTPPYGGPYTLMLDVLFPGQVWASLTPSTYSRDSSTVNVHVTGGPCVPLDLGPVFNQDGISYDTDRSDGDFDGQGHTFPAELMPPDVPNLAEGLYPSGYWCAVPAGPESQRRIVFRYPPKLDGALNVVACAGQEIKVPADLYRRLHLLGAAIGPKATGTLVLNYHRGPRPVELSMSAWDAGPAHGEAVGLMTSHRHAPSGDEINQPAYLFHYLLDLEVSQPLQSLTLPQNQTLKIVALTLERPQFGP